MPLKRIIIAFLICLLPQVVFANKNFKSTSRYRYKAETGAYIEVSRNEVFSICPDKEIQGTWISEHSVALNAENCISVQASNLAGTFRVLFLQNSGRMDTVQVLVAQSYIQMGDYSHRVWVDDPMPEECKYGNVCIESDYGHYENKKYIQSLIVDKTELTMGDARYYSEFGVRLNAISLSIQYPSNEDFKTSMRAYVEVYNPWKFANMRSKLEGLDTVYIFTPEGERSFSNFTLDTSASGYRLPFKDEWGMLMRAGASTRYYWGDEEDSLTVSRYAWVRPLCCIQHKVAQKQPNAFGLYDMISPNNTYDASGDGRICSRSPLDNQMQECRFLAGKVASRVESDRMLCFSDGRTEKCEKSFRNDFFSTSIRLLRKTPKLHKLDKF
ncbi:MAG: formylglycine-generating enzyme family protein [Fibromonadaceae bacterium]|nr:formylglycine-generating enzyme family protein [Fibromonadaceae bacterium]